MEDFGPIVRNWGYYGPQPAKIGDLHVSKGQYMGGFIAGIMGLHSWIPKPPGHVCNASTFPFPVRYLVVEGADQARVHGNDESLLPNIIATAKQLERDGCRFITASCGYFGHYQKEVADAVDAPVYLSSVIQIPWITVSLRKDQKVGVICADAPHFDYELFKSCRVSDKDADRCVIYGAQDKEVFSTLMHKPGHYDMRIVRKEICDLAVQMVQEHPEVGAILLECTDMPPYSADIQALTNLPVYDVATMIKFLGNTMCQMPYYGFI